jgi:lysozyme
MMDISTKGLEVIKHYEDCPTSNGKCHLYRDGTGPHPSGVLTIGFGHVVAEANSEHYKNGITIEQAIVLLHDDLAKFVQAANRLIKVHTNANEFDACVSLIFNNGELPLHQHLGQYLNQQKYADAAQQFQLWCNAQVHGRKGPVEGLFYRRLTETLLFLTGEVMFAHTWAAAQPIIKKIQTYFSARGKSCTVPHYSPAQFIG